MPTPGIEKLLWEKGYRNHKGGNSATWLCRHKIKNGKDGCRSFPLKEVELISIINEMLISSLDDFDRIAELYMSYYTESQTDNTDNSQKISDVENEIEHLNARKDKLLDFSLDEKISNAEFAKRNEKLNNEITALEKEKRILISNLKQVRDRPSEIKQIKNKIKTYIVNGELELTQASVNDMIDRIYVDTIDKYHA